MLSSKDQDITVEDGVAEMEHISEKSLTHTTPDPHDPQTWSALRKLTILFITGIWVFLGTANMILVGPALQIIPKELGSSFSTSTYLIGGPLLAYGVASFFWVPLANRYGVRLVYVLSSIAAGCMSVWAAKATTFGSLVAARTLASGFFAPPETLTPQMVGDVFYLKDRAKAMTWIGILQGSGFAAGPLIGSYIIQNPSLGWRWTEWIIAIITLSLSFFLFLLFPETQYTRCPDVEKPTRSWVDDFRFWPVSGGGKPKVHSLAHAVAAIFPYFCHPVIILNTAFFSLCLVVANYLLTSQSLTYLIVYHFSIGHSGLTFLAPLLGIWTAMFFSGVLGDRLYLRMTANGTKPKPEHRLPLLVFTGLVGVAGTILFGACTQEKCHWIGPLFGSGAMLFCFISGFGISFSYLLDVYEARTDTVMVMYNGMKNFAAFGISYAIVPWNTSAGYTVPFVVMAVILLVAHLLMLLVYVRGERMRRWAAQRFVTARETHHGEAF